MDILVVAKNFTEKPGRLVKTEVTVKKIMSSFSAKTLGISAVSALIPGASIAAGAVMGKALIDAINKLGLEVLEVGANSSSYIERKANVVDKKTLLSSSLKYDDPIFSGVFLNKTQYISLLKNLPSDDSDIVICDPKLAYTIYGVTVPYPGVYLAENHFVVAANKFSEGKLERLRTAILETFSNLGASRISVKDLTSTNMEASTTLSKEIIKNAEKLDISFSKKLDFDFTVEYNPSNSSIDPTRAKKAVLDLDCAPELAQAAKHLISKPGTTSKIKKMVHLDISFGMKADLISVFQGSYQGGYIRNFAVEIDF